MIFLLDNYLGYQGRIHVKNKQIRCNSVARDIDALCIAYVMYDILMQCTATPWSLHTKYVASLAAFHLNPDHQNVSSSRLCGATTYLHKRIRENMGLPSKAPLRSLFSRKANAVSSL